MSAPQASSTMLRVVRWLLCRPPLRVTKAQAIAVAAREHDPEKSYMGIEYAAREHLSHWEVEVKSRFIPGPVLATVEIDGETGEVISFIRHHH